MNLKCKFVPGDRVRLKKGPLADFICDGKLKHDIGTVTIINPPDYTPSYRRTALVGVEWDELKIGHSIGGRCRDGHGWNIDEYDLESAEETIVIDDIDSFL